MPEDELLELLLACLPESLQGWLASVVAVSALLSFILPRPEPQAHPLLKAGHKIISVLGLGATKLRAAGKIGQLLRKKEKPQ